ncbi:cob(I)yrinic acid a,c-diamide adenosyltransferase [Corynebacterium pygosceleis]|uniref:cob(I)yrinic acid a,c-diamide adenosyltransferase n=1 Tax=Corynebacterium pygosceleis TaxID=2800406 RepID=UPI0020038EF7|nr:cob(I)yrinic acid a,c-diamide adenosyltransferase [Corynebacterium pygosceleis]MCK7674269.1 cob(I)yrinic acid a,c-diamide adenosyltransferase [Corynebacterium pygosceleis]
MPKGKPDPASIPDDGLTTRQRRMLPVTVVHTGPGKGKSTAAFGMALRAWNQGMSIGVFQFVKSAKWKVGEEAVFRRLGELHEQTGEGGAVEWHKMGEGWSWARKPGVEEDHARDAAEGWAEIRRRIETETHDFYVLDEFTYPIKWGWIDVDDVVATLTDRPGRQHIVMTGRDADPKLIEVADLVTEMTKIRHPMDQGRKGQKGIEW